MNAIAMFVVFSRNALDSRTNQIIFFESTEKRFEIESTEKRMEVLWFGGGAKKNPGRKSRWKKKKKKRDKNEYSFIGTGTN